MCTFPSRALLLMAAQGKSRPEETFDVPSARNGFSGIGYCGFEEAKVSDARRRRRLPNTLGNRSSTRTEYFENNVIAGSLGLGFKILLFSTLGAQQNNKVVRFKIV